MAAWLGLRPEEAEAGAEACSWQYDSTWEEEDDEEKEEEEEKEKEQAGDEDRLEDAEEPARGSGQAQVGPGGFGGGRRVPQGGLGALSTSQPFPAPAEPSRRGFWALFLLNTQIFSQQAEQLKWLAGSRRWLGLRSPFWR